MDVLHYLDDFLLITPTEATGKADLRCALELCRDLGVPIAAHKTEGPATTIKFLRIELDTVARTLEAP